MIDSVVEPMAKKIAKKVEAEEKARKPMILQVRGSEEFKQWYEEVARFDGLSPTAFFDRAIRRYAKEIGFTKEAPQR